MKLKIIGCYGAFMNGFRLTTFILNERIAMDAGSMCSMDLSDQLKLDHIFITHAHLDHTIDLAFLVDNVFSFREAPINIYGAPDTINTIKSQLFTGDLWIEFDKIPFGNPRIVFRRISPNERIAINGLEIRPIPVKHIVTTYGYIMTQNGVSIAYTGDFIDAPLFWEEVNKLDNLSAVIVETSFPNRLIKIARVSRHLTPSLLKKELMNLKKDCPIYLYHIKPQFIDEIVSDLDKEDIQRDISLLNQDDVLEFN